MMGYLQYICVTELGERLKPNTLSAGFDNSGSRWDACHPSAWPSSSCTSLLLANGVPMKQIQE